MQKSYNGVGLFGMRFPFLSDPASVQPSTLSPENIFLVQSEVMNSIANEGDALFVGRCADYVLRARQDLLSVFISASLDDRVARVARRNGCSADEALGIVRRMSKQRAAYYDYFANKTWGAASSYDLCLNSSRFSVGEIVEIIVKCAHSKLK